MIHGFHGDNLLKWLLLLVIVVLLLVLKVQLCLSVLLQIKEHYYLKKQE